VTGEGRGGSDEGQRVATWMTRSRKHRQKRCAMHPREAAELHESGGSARNLLEPLLDTLQGRSHHLPRFKWQLTFASSWIFTAVAGVSNIIVLSMMK
jgi:hypothetical protein